MFAPCLLVGVNRICAAFNGLIHLAGPSDPEAILLNVASFRIDDGLVVLGLAPHMNQLVIAVRVNGVYVHVF
jgi:hypothetical protein